MLQVFGLFHFGNHSKTRQPDGPTKLNMGYIICVEWWLSSVLYHMGYIICVE